MKFQSLIGLHNYTKSNEPQKIYNNHIKQLLKLIHGLGYDVKIKETEIELEEIA